MTLTPVTLPSPPPSAPPALAGRRTPVWLAVLAASPGREAADVAAEMVRIRDTVDPRPEMLGRFDDGYLRLVGELEGRGWLPGSVAAHARGRTNTGR